jgi:ABC-type polysaccharide/polyol phosphate export permease
MLSNLVRSACELPEYGEVLRNLVARDLKAKYQSAALGLGWSLLHPAILLGIWYFVFHRAGLLRDAMPRYWAYLLSGMLVYQFIAAAIVEGSLAIRRNAGIVRKVYLPLEILVVAGVTVKFVEFLIQLAVALVLLAAMHHGAGGAAFAPIKTLVILPAALVLVYLFALGVALPLSAWTVLYRDLDHVINLTLSALFYLTPVFWSAQMLWGTEYGWLIVFNPVADLLALFHGPLYWGTWPANIMLGGGAGSAWSVAIAFTAIVFITGYQLFDRAKTTLAEVV